METEISLVSLVVSILALAISSVVGYFFVRSVVDKTRKDYREQQPDVRVHRLSAMSSGNTLTIFPIVRNLGKVPAYDCELTLDGWADKIEMRVVHPAGPNFQEYEQSITLGPESAIRSQAIEPARDLLSRSSRTGPGEGVL